MNLAAFVPEGHFVLELHAAQSPRATWEKLILKPLHLQYFQLEVNLQRSLVVLVCCLGGKGLEARLAATTYKDCVTNIRHEDLLVYLGVISVAGLCH